MANPAPLKFPVPLGKLTAGASFATVSVRLDANLPAGGGPDGVAFVGPYNEIGVSADYGNEAPCYICVPITGQAASLAPDVTTFTNVIAVLQPGESWPRALNPAYADKWFLSDYYIGFLNDSDFAIGYAGRQ